MDSPDVSRFYRFLADLTLIVHVCFVLFVVVGQVLILAGWARRWRWARNMGFRWTHLGGIGFVVAEAWLGVICPLTTLENHFRTLAGVAGYERSFIGHWLGRLIYYDAPAWVFTALYTGFAVIVVVSFIGYPPKRDNDGRLPQASDRFSR